MEDSADTLVAASAAKPLPVDSLNESADTASVAATADAATSATLLSANTARKGFIIENDSDQVLYIKYGTTASATDRTGAILPTGIWSEDKYTGRVDGIWAANSTGNARVTDLV